jgi:hypothetical protein
MVTACYDNFVSRDTDERLVQTSSFLGSRVGNPHLPVKRSPEGDRSNADGTNAADDQVAQTLPSFQPLEKHPQAIFGFFRLNETGVGGRIWQYQQDC